LPLLYAGVSARERHARAHEALEHVGLANACNHHPNQMSAGNSSGWQWRAALVTGRA